FALAGRLRGSGLLLTTALVFCFVLAYVASAVGLAAIVGAYAAGLVLEEAHYVDFARQDERRLGDLVRSIGTLLVPVFFVLMGMRVELRSFAHPEVLGLAVLLPLARTGGAYAAGLVLEEAQYVDFARQDERRLGDLVRPIGTLLVPVFFVLMGMRVELRSFAHPEVLGLALLLTLAAIAGKQACALGGLGAPLDRLSIGIGMIPRGEVGLIFANLGPSLTLHGERILS